MIVTSGRPMAARLKIQKGGSGWSRLSVSKKSERYGVIPNQSADWCGNPPVERKSYWFRIENI